MGRWRTRRHRDEGFLVTQVGEQRIHRLGQLIDLRAGGGARHFVANGEIVVAIGRATHCVSQCAHRTRHSARRSIGDKQREDETDRPGHDDRPTDVGEACTFRVARTQHDEPADDFTTCRCERRALREIVHAVESQTRRVPRISGLDGALREVGDRVKHFALIAECRRGNVDTTFHVASEEDQLTRRRDFHIVREKRINEFGRHEHTDRCATRNFDRHGDRLKEQ